jgi:hypothetical protein
MLAPLPPQEVRELPPRPLSFWSMIGPGAVLVGLSVGAGEIVIWPKLVAEHGAGMVWAAVLGVLMQLFVNFEIGRWTVCTGETMFTGYARVWRGFGPLFILLTILGWLAPGWAQVSGAAIKALLVGPNGPGGTTAWTCITFGIVALMLFGPRIAYKMVEKSIEVLVAIITLGLIAVAIAVGTRDAWWELGSGIINFGHKPEGVSAKQLFIAIVFAGAGGTANLFYSFYLRDKHIGMGAHLPAMQNPLRGSTETIPATGFTFAETDENRSRFKKWMDYIRKDQLLFFWFLNTLTMLLFIFGALAVLRPAGIVLNSETLIWDESQVLARVWGEPGRVIFLLVGVATLFSTQLALVDGASRSIADIVYTNFSAARSRSAGWWYTAVATVWILAACGITAALDYYQVKEIGVLFNAAYMGGFAMAIYVPLTLYINHRYLPKSARPGWLSSLIVGCVAVVYVAFAVFCLWTEVTSRMG